MKKIPINQVKYFGNNLMTYILLFFFIITQLNHIYANSQEEFTFQKTKIGKALQENQIIRLDQKIEGTIWTAADIERDLDLYVFFQDYSKGIIITQRGGEVAFPSEMFPMKFLQAGKNLNSGIFLVSSQGKILYYAMRLFSEKYLGISAGYESIEPLINISTSDYFEKGYILQFVPIN